MPVDRATSELFVPLDRAAPLRAQLEDAICAAITGGGAPPGTRLPASRVLAETLGVSRGVVSEAYAQIAAEGWIEVRHGAAPVVRAVPTAGHTNLKGSDPFREPLGRGDRLHAAAQGENTPKGTLKGQTPLGGI